MQSEADEVTVNYFTICDQVIAEAQTGKQSIIGVYSALTTDQVPIQMNLAVAFSARVQTATVHSFNLRLTGPEGEQVLASPPLPTDANTLIASLRAYSFATIQFGVTLRGVTFERTGVYTMAIYCDGDLLATYPLAITLRTAA